MREPKPMPVVPLRPLTPREESALKKIGDDWVYGPDLWKEGVASRLLTNLVRQEAVERRATGRGYSYRVRRSAIRQLSRQAPRVESGVTRFGDDWPGLFLRGDHCFDYAMKLRSLLDGTAGRMDRVVLGGLLESLEATRLK